jgi:hypothetical protein
MTGGVGLPVRERGVSHARARAHEWAAQWAEPEEEKGSRPGSVFVFLFQNFE